MRFVKMHGIGNDYVFVDCFRETLPEPPETLAPKVAAPHTGVASDGLILIEPSPVAHARMRVFNADGSEAKMCGNGLRCVAKYVHDAGIAPAETLLIDTLSGVKRVSLALENGLAVRATADMGEPSIGEALTARAAGRDWRLTPVSMGNPHAVAVVESLPDDETFQTAGAALEVAPVFPDRANIEFVCVEAPDRLRVRVFERGSGETLACGTGACAALVAASARGACARKATVALPGGSLLIDWRADNHVFMTGPMAVSFVGEWRDTL